MTRLAPRTPTFWVPLGGDSPLSGTQNARRRRRRLLDAQAVNSPGNHQLLDLLGAFEDVVDLGVAVHALDRVLARVAVTAVDLDGALGDPHRHPTGLELRLRSLGIGVSAVASEPRGSPH